MDWEKLKSEFDGFSKFSSIISDIYAAIDVLSKNALTKDCNFSRSMLSLFCKLPDESGFVVVSVYADKKGYKISKLAIRTLENRIDPIFVEDANLIPEKFHEVYFGEGDD